MTESGITRLRRARRGARLESAAFFGGLLALAMVVGGGLFGWAGALYAAVLGAGGLWLAPSVPAAWIVRARGARPLRPDELPELRQAVAVLATRAELPRRPSLHLAPSAEPNAYAVGGPRDAALVVTPGLLHGMTLREVVNVLAHEVSHVRHRDVAVMGLASTFGRLTAFVSRAGMFLIVLALPLAMAGAVAIPWNLVPTLWVAPTVANLLLLALSRRRELDADLGAVELTGDPLGLASALERLEGVQRRAMARARRRGVVGLSVPEWLRTHPRTETRVARLRAIAGPPRRRTDRGPSAQGYRLGPPSFA